MQDPHWKFNLQNILPFSHVYLNYFVPIDELICVECKANRVAFSVSVPVLKEHSYISTNMQTCVQGTRSGPV